ncbi:MAG: choice-of-anchor D domain-containing protein, partial [Bacteroidota bacterium]
AVATIYIAARSFPLQVIGRGIRRYLIASVISSECDTVLYAPGVETSAMIQLENRGDTVVHIDAPTLKAAATGLFRFASPTIFPLDLPPGGMLQVEVIFSPQRESGEVAVVDFPNNGDTLAGASLCFIARSRYLSVSQSSVVFGSICLGDTATALITIENPGGFDSVDLRSATLAPSDVLGLAGFAPRTLGPREYLSLIIRYIPTAPGSLSGSLTIAGSRGDVVIPIGGMALTPARFTIRSGTMTIGDTVTLPVDAGGFAAAATLNGARLTLEYDAKLLMPIKLVALPGGPALDDALSQLRIIGGGKATLDVGWAGGFTGGPAFGIRCEALRGDGLRARAAIDGVTAEGLCVARSEATLTLLPPCVGSSGFVNADSAEFVAIAPSPASESISVTLVTSADEVVDLEIVSTLGRVVAVRRMESASGRVRTIAIPVGDLPTGDYFIRARAGDRVIDARRLMIAR